jgi:hypothetical protein
MKRQISRIDNRFLGGIIRRSRAHLFDVLRTQLPVAGCDRKIVIHYKKDPTLHFAMLCDKYGSDKGEIATFGHPYPWPSTTYADFYTLLFAGQRDSICNVFECGIGTNSPNLASSMGERGKPGASLRVWRDYFPNAKVVGADIDRDILFEDDRICTHYVDQRNPDSIRKLWSSVGVESFEIMVDDGLHLYEAGICLFENSIQMLGRNGVYIIEDVPPKDLVKYHNYFASKPYRVEYINLLRSDAITNDHNLVVIRKETIAV